MDGGRNHERMDDSDSENTISDAKSISESDTFDENHRVGQVPNLRYLFYNQPKALFFFRSEPRSLSEPVDFSLRSLKVGELIITLS